MEGNAKIEGKDRVGVDSRFMMMAAVDMPSSGRTKGNWYTAYPPLCRDYTGLTPADYFGRTMVENLPENIKVGVINVAVGGCAIELFDEDKCASQIKNAEQWFKNYCAEYGNNPYKVLVTMAKKAQQKGVIKGILLHQGCSNNTQKDWPLKVKRVYTRLLNDLGLNEEETPLLIGELLSQNQGGVCWGHNSVIAKTASVIPNSYVISSKDCPGASDGLHFTAEGYRMIGKRYAEKMLELLDKKKEIDFDTSETYFPLKPEAFNPSLYLEGQFASVGAAKYYTGKEKYNDEGGFGGWRYSKGADFSNHKYLVVELKRKATCKPVVKIFDTDDYLNPCFSVAIPASEKKVVISLDEMKTEEGKKVDPSHIYMVGFTTDTSNSLYIENVFLSDDGETPATGVESLQAPQADAKVIYYDLTGKVVENPTNGIYIRSTDHKKVLMK
jgi:lysophospholipase L1-like esterase